MSIVFIAYISHIFYFLFFFFNDTATTEIYTLSLHDALPISAANLDGRTDLVGLSDRYPAEFIQDGSQRSEEHTSELQSPCNLVCRLLLEKKKKKIIIEKTCETIISRLLMRSRQAT